MNEQERKAIEADIRDCNDVLQRLQDTVEVIADAKWKVKQLRGHFTQQIQQASREA